MEEKDFFDEELERQQSEQRNNAQDSFDSWSNHGGSAPNPPAQRKNGWIIALICVGLALCVALGWILGVIFGGGSSQTIEPMSQSGNAILDTVMQYMRDKYYQDISNEQWQAAIEQAGTAFMQTAGDRYSHLMSPQTYYDFMYPEASVGSGSTEVFGVSFTVEEGLGMYISAVTVNSNAYGNLQEGDIVLMLTDIRDKQGNIPEIASVQFDKMLLSQWTSSTIQAVLNKTYSATFHYLRMVGEGDDATYEIGEINLHRSQIQYVNTNYPYQFVEFYFDRSHNNISVQRMGQAAVSTYEYLGLDQMPADTGYVHITEFMDYTFVNDNGSIGKVSAAEEFSKVMQLFKQLGLKRLVLDLKGNPGGNVQYVSEIASMLVTDAKLTNEQQKAVNGRNGLLITTLEYTKENTSYPYYMESTYDDYFGTPTDIADIVVWTDGGSASASELLTGALLDYGTAVQMGVTTYGKGIAQTWEELPFRGTVVDLNGAITTGNWAIYYTCAKYYSPLGNNIHGVGYTPSSKYNGLTSYQSLWQAARSYWGVN